MLYWDLFWSFFKIGLFSFGGGLAALPLVQHQVVDIHGWMTLASFGDLVAISEMTPGPIAINAATFIGTQVAGLGGALAATFGCVLAPCLIASLLAWLYGKYQKLPLLQNILSALRGAVLALILSAGLSILVLALWGPTGFSWSFQSLDLIALSLFSSALVLLRKYRPSPILLMFGCGLVGGAGYLLV